LAPVTRMRELRGMVGLVRGSFEVMAVMVGVVGM